MFWLNLNLWHILAIKYATSFCIITFYCILMLNHLSLAPLHSTILCSPEREKYSRRYIERWQWEEGQCTRTIILPCVRLNRVISPLPFILFTIDACPGHILESTNGIEMKLGFIDRWQWEEGQCTRTIILPCILT